MGACFRTGKSLEKDRSTRHSVSLGFSTGGLSSCSEAFPRGTRHGDTKRADIKYRFAKEREEINVGGLRLLSRKGIATAACV
jgi:hypothetical protein